MKKRSFAILIVLAMLLCLVPVTAFAAEGYGIMVGSTEVTTANYKNITGSGISGKVSYDPNTNTLILNNASITSYYDADPTIGDQYGILTVLDHLNIQFTGTNTIAPANPGKTATYRTGIGSPGNLAFNNCTGTLNINVSYGSCNIGLLCEGQIDAYSGTFNVQAGTAGNSDCYGIYTNNLNAISNTCFTISSGNSAYGKSIALVVLGILTMDNSATVTATSGSATATAGIHANSIHTNPGNTITATAGTASEYDSYGIYADDTLLLAGGTIYAAGGSALKGSSFGLTDGGTSFTDFSSNNLTFIGGSAPNGISAGFFSANSNEDGTYHVFVNGKIRALGGDALYSFGIYMDNNSAGFLGCNVFAQGGTSAKGDSTGICALNDFTINNSIMETYGGDAPNGVSTGIYSDAEPVLFSNNGNFKVSASGNDQAISFTPELDGSAYYWAANAETTEASRDMNAHTETPLTDADQYKYLYVVSENYNLPTPFDDVPKDAYYIDPVLWAVENNITVGTSAITFSPDDTCTRAQTVTFLWRNAGCPTPTSTKMPFTDVKADDYFYDAVLWAVENGITVGTTETTFSPEDTVTRAQVVTLLWRQQGTPDMGSKNPFSDVSSGEYYYNGVLWAVDTGITVGTSHTAFSPDEGCTRAQIVTFLHRLVLSQPLSADYADEELLSSDDYSECILDTSEYAVDIAFRANTVLKNVTFSSITLTDAGMQTGEALYTQEELSPDLPVVVRVAFPGDLTTYCISFTDPSGNTRCYTVSISGKDGSLLLQEYNVT